MVENRKKFTGFIKVIIIVSITLVILSLNPRIQKLEFEFQTDKLYINTEAQYGIQKEKAIETLNIQ
ncbi:MAG: hypothetical protein WCZ27_02285 [Tissierellaceae bacterium]